MIKVDVIRANDEFGFEARDAYGHTVRIDSSPESGGVNFGVRPMQLLLMALGGCSGIDIVSILKKQRQTVRNFNIRLEGDRETGTEPSLWKNIAIVFELEGEIDQDKADKACALSIDKYCSVAATLKKAGASITWRAEVKP